MYCSEDCMLQHRNEFHQFECGIFSAPKELDGLQMFCQLLNQFDWDFDSLKNFIEAQNTSKSVFEFDLSKPKNRKFLMISSLSAKEPLKVINQRMLSGIFKIQSDFIEKHSKLKKIFHSKHSLFACKTLKMLNKLAFAQLKSAVESDIRLNINESSDEPKPSPLSQLVAHKTTENVVDTRLDPYISLLNHSCFPSVKVHFVDGKYVWKVAHPINAGDQIFIRCHDFLDVMTPRSARRKATKLEHGFACDCIACENEWPLLYQMPAKPEVVDKFSKLCSSPRADNVEDVKMWEKFVDETFQYMPVIEIFKAINLIDMNIAQLRLPAKWFCKGNFLPFY